MKVVWFYCDIRVREEKIKAYSKIGFKVAVFVTLLMLNPASSVAFKTGNIGHLISGIPNVIN